MEGLEDRCDVIKAARTSNEACCWIRAVALQPEVTDVVAPEVTDVVAPEVTDLVAVGFTLFFNNIIETK